MKDAARHLWPRLLAAFLLLALLAAAAAGVGLPVWSLSQSYSERIAEQQRLLGEYRRIAAGSEGMQRDVQRLERWQSSSNLYLRANTAALAAAELQRIVKQQAAARGGRVMSTQTLAGKQEDAFTRVTLKVRLRTDMQGVLHTLHGLESRRPLLFIDNLSIRSRTSRRRDPTTGKPIEAVELDITFEVSGFMRSAVS
ncbi:MAG: type II secretion system protein GspM [Gammaproteobacteria bacterium]|nr:type II secretion system protein GspM [Gammaproteobacteria bacterium]